MPKPVKLQDGVIKTLDRIRGESSYNSVIKTMLQNSPNPLSMLILAYDKLEKTARDNFTGVMKDGDYLNIGVVRVIELLRPMILGVAKNTIETEKAVNYILEFYEKGGNDERGKTDKKSLKRERSGRGSCETKTQK